MTSSLVIRFTRLAVVGQSVARSSIARPPASSQTGNTRPPPEPSTAPAGSAHAVHATSGGAVVAGQLPQRPPIRRRAHGLHQGLDPGIPFRPRREAEVVGLLADFEEAESGLFAHQAKADSRVGPATAD